MSVLVGKPYSELLPEEQTAVDAWFEVFSKMTELGVQPATANSFLTTLWDLHLSHEAQALNGNEEENKVV